MNWEAIRAHLCTLAVAVSFNSTWRVPREAYRYGGVSYLLVLSIAMVIFALPATLMQLTIGQLSQQDAVGVWRAVPFFKGVGYIRLLISYIASIYSIIYVALSVLIYLLFTVNRSIPIWECTKPIVISLSLLFCYSSTFLAPLAEQPEYYLALSMLTIVLWIIFPFIFYNPIKLMKRILYALGPLVLILMVVIASCIGSRSNLAMLQRQHDWLYYLESKIWHSAVIQAVLSSQAAGGFLMSSGTAIYSNTDVQRTTWLLVTANVVCSWLGVIFWFSVAGGSEDRDETALAVLVQMYRAAEYHSYHIIWPILVYALLFFSGIISMLVQLFPLYDNFRRVGGQGWRLISFTGSFFGAAAALGVLVGGLPVLSVLEDTAVPLLISIATGLEVLAFIFIYGWKLLVEDVEFLTGRALAKPWVFGWIATPVVVLAVTVWWVVAIFLGDEQWTEAPWDAATILATASVAATVFIALAAASVAKQVQFDILGKIKSSFNPSRHWGPRDPITYYYWMARRQQSQTGARDIFTPMYTRRHLGQFTGGARIFDISQPKKNLEESN
ncbi:sodium- and chloride-dependent neutral and basic amino acid transporter B(0+)-like [Cydia strobilella]|uniref:sodium- and chloride-dependent neutral and basic amino acid transporter B(0+)-like n=1 Tax=Cydia strobilella TaxID=1100964 RepID=UPI003005E246